MKKYFLGLSLLLGSILMCTNYVSGAGIPEKGKEKPYLQEMMKKVPLPVEGASKILKFIRLGETIAAVSTDRIFFFENGKWRIENTPGHWQTAGADNFGKIGLGGIGQVRQAGERVGQGPAPKSRTFSIDR